MHLDVIGNKLQPSTHTIVRNGSQTERFRLPHIHDEDLGAQVSNATFNLRAADPHKLVLLPLEQEMVTSRPVFNTVVALLQPTMAGCPTPA